jgi:hypothetical protein
VQAAAGVATAGIEAPRPSTPAAVFRASPDCRDRHRPSIDRAGRVRIRGDHDGDRGFPAPAAAP